MKRILFLCALLGLVGSAALEAQNEKSRMLIVYYSYSGNTQTLAKEIQKATGADLFEIKTVEAYPEEYQAVVDQAKKEIADRVRPAIQALPENLEDYDVVFVGSPNWWSTIAPPVSTLLSKVNLKGKTVVPFITHGSGGMADCEKDVKALCPRSDFKKGLAINGNVAEKSSVAVQKWLKEIGLGK
ncbi:MAG: NAD(P)H-dependent oxidoreductase [Bacteroidales bacterium]|nr:NAD(P)H-dependent oxidoreductase [Bacteroidales bacterium]MDE7072903.1 NAD(P)H-dependent oxidoreductase [Bacteroidales bacterium]